MSSAPPSPLLLAGKTAIITGGTTGIGRAITLEFLRQGAHVVVNHLGLPGDAPHLASLLAAAEALPSDGGGGGGGRLAHRPGDVRDPATAQDLVSFAAQHHSPDGRVDICVSNAGVCRFEDFLAVEPDLLAKTVRTNLDGAFYVVQAAARHMAHAQSPPGGSIIAVSSISALVGGARQTHYTPTKAGVLSLMQSCAAALGRHGIRCNALLPGTIHSQLNAEDLADPDKRAYMETRTPLGRIGEPEDLAGPAVFLACEKLSGFVTGAQLLVDGGMFVNLQ
jgi:L-rhamnose 1-dehydrogenase